MNFSQTGFGRWLFESLLPDFKHAFKSQTDAQWEIAKQLKRLADLKENEYLETKDNER